LAQEFLTHPNCNQIGGGLLLPPFFIGSSDEASFTVKHEKRLSPPATPASPATPTLSSQGAGGDFYWDWLLHKNNKETIWNA